MQDEGDHSPPTSEQVEVEPLNLDHDNGEDGNESETGNRMLAALAADSGGRMRRLGPGIWLESKISSEPPIG